MKPIASGSYFSQASMKDLMQSSPTRTLYSSDDAWKPSRIIAIKRLRKTRLTVRIKVMK